MNEESKSQYHPHEDGSGGPHSHYSKVTSLVRRQADEMGLGEDDLQYSQSSATYYFQLDRMLT